MITRRATDQGVAFLDVETPLCTATLCLQGAHLTSWKPEGQEECLFLSPPSHRIYLFIYLLTPKTRFGLMNKTPNAGNVNSIEKG